MQPAPRTLEDLAFGDVLLALARRCRTEAGRQRALVRPLLDSAVEIADALTRVEEARTLGQEQFSLPLGGLGEVRVFVERAAKSGLLEPRELITVAQTLFAFVRTREALEEREAQVPVLALLARGLPSLEPLALRVDRCFESDGEISDRASPDLKEARDRVRGLHRSIKGRLDGLLHDDQFLPNLRENYYTLRNGRYVVPVLSQFRAEVPGIVHNASQSGQTLFVEPQAMVGLGNDLAIAQSFVVEEERRVLQELSDAVGRESTRILTGVDAAAALDEAEAAARLGADLDAHTPTVEREEGELELRQLRHPLLVLRGREVVANDVRMAGDVRAMVISGPNAGGKTVTLTAVGLCALMLRCGLQIPAASGSRLPLYRSIHSAVGDAQDMSQDLSTFSAHVRELRNIIGTAGQGSLVLVDEIAADTDPKEGAAIAIAVLEELISRDARALVTTHLEELKAMTHVDPRFLNARVGFDAKRMAPTYKLQLGVAGASSAIDVAERMGLPSSIIVRARELARNAGGPVSQALQAAEEERRKLAEQVERARVAADSLEKERAGLTQAREETVQRRRVEDVEHALRLKEAWTSATDEVGAMLTALRNDAQLRDTERVRAVLSSRVDAAQKLVRTAQVELARAETPLGSFELRPGTRAHHFGLDRDVEVLELSGANEALVSAGPLKMRVSRDELVAPREKKTKPAGFPSRDKQKSKLENAEAAAPQAVQASNLRCDIRGMRADEAVREVEKFLDQAFRSGDAAALILHGHGTGALRQSVREYLSGSPYVRLYRPGENHEGGDGVTVVTLRA